MKFALLSALALGAAQTVVAGGEIHRVLHRAEFKQKPAVNPQSGQTTSQGCFSSVGNMTKVLEKDYTTMGSCSKLCLDESDSYNTMATYDKACYCGVLYPPKDSLGDDSKCNLECSGYPEACGGIDKKEREQYYSVYNLGREMLPENYEEKKSTSSAAKSSTEDASTATSTSTHTADKTAVVTASETPTDSSTAGDDKDKDGGGPNVAGIAAGVVVGVVVVAAAIGGAFFYIRRKRNAEIEEDYRRNAAVNAFISGSKPPSSNGSISMTDSRLDPVMAHRRMSDGSIADNQDYSRRILRVTNA